MKIGLVCPYIYPESGGVAQHVRFLYENLRLRGHDVRIITASHGPQRASEGDILRIGVGFSMPTNGSVGTLTFSPRYIGQVEDAARARAVRPPPFPRAVRAVPVALPAARIDGASTSRRSMPTRASRRRTSSAAGSCAATLRGSTAGSQSARPRVTSSTASSRATTRSSPTASMSAGSPTRSRSRAGRTARRTCCSWDATSRARACSTCSRHTGSCARWATSTASSSWLRAAGARGAAIRRDARPPGRRVPRTGVRRGEGAALPDGRRLRLAGDRR